ncbi:hypothetical protein B1B_07031, partial [mine drainage metagenome]
GLRGALPWMEGLKIGEARMQGLLGPEGDAGQGLRAVAALVGHSHPNTTIRHYTHVLCVALHGVLHKLDGSTCAAASSSGLQARPRSIGGWRRSGRPMTRRGMRPPNGIDSTGRSGIGS